MASNVIRNNIVNGSLQVSDSSARWKPFPDNYPTVIEKYTSCRWRLCYWMILGFVFAQSMQISMSFAVVCMTRSTSPMESDTSNKSFYSSNNITTSSALSNLSDKTMVIEAEFDYSTETRGLLISSVYYLGIISPIMGSFASRKFGPKRVILVSMVTGGVVMMFLPLALRTHLYLAVFCRIIIGMTVNTLMPVSFDFWLYWAPVDEKGQLMAYTYNGVNIANILTFAVSGFLCLIPIDNGWPFIFYVFGSCTILWCVAWLLMVYETPDSHPSITGKEKAYIHATRSNIDNHFKEKKIPWKSMAQTRGVWAFILLQVCHAWNSSILFSYLPSYMASVLKFDITQNGLLSSLPYVSRVLSTMVTAYISRKLLNVLSVTHTRKLIQSVGYFGAAGLAVALCYIEEGQEYIAVAIFVISTPFQVATVNSGFVTPLDMAPQYASFITSIAITCVMIAMMTSPITVSYILKEMTREQWNYVFYMSAGVYIFAAVFFLIFGSGKLQPWAYSSETDTDVVNSANKGEVNAAYISEKDEVTPL